MSQILGHELQRGILERATKENMVSHAYLFAGPDGIGKKLIAIEFAKMLNCLDNTDKQINSQCECGSCRKIDKRIHPDVIFVEYEGVKNIKVEQIREEVEEKIYFKSFEGKFKVVIVDESERMSVSAQNAFLKTLEEPPQSSVIILLSSQPQILLPTIRSRCQTIRFNGLPMETILEALSKNPEFTPEEAKISSGLSDGSLGKALKLDSDTIEWRMGILETLNNMTPHEANRIIELAESIPTGSSQEETEKLDLLFQFISLWLRDLALIKIGGTADSVSNVDIVEPMEKLAGKWSIQEINHKHEYLEQTWKDIFNSNANKQLALENLFIQLSQSGG